MITSGETLIRCRSKRCTTKSVCIVHIKALTVAFLAAVSTSLVNAGVQEGIRAMDRGDYPRAIKEFEALAKEGDSRSMVSIGLMYFQGAPNFEKDFGKARDWYIKAIEKGNGDGYNNLGALYFDGFGVSQDIEMAHALYSYAAEHGNEDTVVRAERNLGRANSIITADQLKRAMAILKDGLTAEKLKNWKSDPGSARQMISLLPPEAWNAMAKTYNADKKRSEAAAAKTKVVEATKDNYEQIPGGGFGFSFKKIALNDDNYKDGFILAGKAGFKVRPPCLSTGEVVARFSDRKEYGETRVSFFEKGVTPTFPWPAGQRLCMADILRLEGGKASESDLPKMLEHIEKNGEELFFTLGKNNFKASIIEGALGKVFQVVVLNRIPDPLYPYGEPAAAPIRDGLQTIEITRHVFRPKAVYEFNMVVSKPEGIADEKFLPHALERMDLFMGGFEEDATGK